MSASTELLVRVQFVKGKMNLSDVALCDDDNKNWQLFENVCTVNGSLVKWKRDKSFTWASWILFTHTHTNICLAYKFTSKIKATCWNKCVCVSTTTIIDLLDTRMYQMKNTKWIVWMVPFKKYYESATTSQMLTHTMKTFTFTK